MQAARHLPLFLAAATAAVSVFGMTEAMAQGGYRPPQSYDGSAYAPRGFAYAPGPYGYGRPDNDIDANVPAYVLNHPNECYTDDGYGRFRSCEAQ